MTLVSFLVPLAAFAFFIMRRLPRYLHIFQQEDYNGRRFLAWIVRTGAFDKRVSLALLLSALAAFLLRLETLWPFIHAGVFVLFAFFEADPRTDSKKKLVMTARARRIYAVAFALCLVSGVAASWAEATLAWILAVQLVPFLLVLGNLLLAPYEASLQKRIMDEASARLAQVAPKVIGITGSFGKTSVKHILGHILEMNAPTLFTPGSVNTLMGISRIIRENLQLDCRYFLVEMGSYGQGSIERLCRLTPPHVGIITALGEAHYERFKTLETVARAKFELAEAVLAKGAGPVIIHEDVLAADTARRFVEKHRGHFIVCGSSQDSDLIIEQVEQTTEGLTVGLRGNDQSFALFAPLFGVHHAGNVALAFASAVTLGIAPERVIAALRTVPQIKHRLEVKTQPDGTTYIDDAFNSNPRGFLNAVELMTKLATERGGRRILITPGVAELGAKHDDVHRLLGAASANHVDIALVVRPDRIPTFVEGFQVEAHGKELHSFAGFSEAQAWLRENAQPKDIILLENDLPDVLEKKLRL